MVNPVTFTNNADDEEINLAVELFLMDAAAESEMPVPSWTPGTPSPSPFDVSRLSNRIVPRTPIRYELGQDNNKIDPRLVRFTEMVSQILNDLASGGQLVKLSTGWAIAYLPRRVAGTSAFSGEWFFNTDSNRMAYKNADGSVTNY